MSTIYYGFISSLVKLAVSNNPSTSNLVIIAILVAEIQAVIKFHIFYIIIKLLCNSVAWGPI